MARTAIEWVARPETKTRPESWNPVVGCTAVSEGCAHCYARAMHKRFAHARGDPPFDEVTLRYDRLEAPLHWIKPRTVFAGSMCDLFHEDVPWAFVAQVFCTMWHAGGHTFLVLTKRPRRMAAWARWWRGFGHRWPPNVWAGVTVELQKYVGPRLEALAEVPAPIRFVSCEPLLGPVDLSSWLPCAACGATANPAVPPIPPEEFQEEGWFPEGMTCCTCGGGPWTRLAWVICGAESGPGARPMADDWARSLRDQCAAAGVPFFLKQKVVNGRKVSLPELDGEVHAAWPAVETARSER